LLAGRKSNDKNSPAYVPIIISITISAAKCKAEQDLQRYEAGKRRCLLNVLIETSEEEEMDRR